MKKTAIILTLTVMAAFSAMARPLIIPEPAQYTVGEGTFTMPARPSVGGDSKAVAKAMEYLSVDGIKTSKSSPSKADIKVRFDASMKPEHYTLKVTPSAIDKIGRASCRERV